MLSARWEAPAAPGSFVPFGRWSEPRTSVVVGEPSPEEPVVERRDRGVADALGGQRAHEERGRRQHEPQDDPQQEARREAQRRDLPREREVRAPTAAVDGARRLAAAPVAAAPGAVGPGLAVGGGLAPGGLAPELVERGAVVGRVGSSPEEAGAGAVHLVLGAFRHAPRMVADMARGCVIGVDLGGTKLLAGAVTPDRAVRHRAFRLARGDGTQQVLDQLTAVVEEVRAAAGDVEAVGVGVPALIDRRTGVARSSNHLPLQDVPVADVLAERTGLPVFVDNDGNAALLAEWRWGAARGRPGRGPPDPRHRHRRRAARRRDDRPRRGGGGGRARPRRHRGRRAAVPRGLSRPRVPGGVRLGRRARARGPARRRGGPALGARAGAGRRDGGDGGARDRDGP